MSTAITVHSDTRYIIVDTPGQMEVFLWSASGQILLDTLASSYPTVLAYIIDTPRSSSPATFMSNMLYACSVLYKTSLPIVLVCNKTDVKDASFVKDWMTDFEKFQEAVSAERSADGEEGMGFMGSLMGSMGLVLEEFYHTLDVIPRPGLPSNSWAETVLICIRWSPCRPSLVLEWKISSKQLPKKNKNTTGIINPSSSDEYASGQRKRRRRVLTN